MADGERSAIVIGAGASGLAAAKELRAQGFAVTVIEARDRIGGRVWTHRQLGVAIDLGAQWITGIEGNPIKKIATDNHVVTKPTDYTSVATYDMQGRAIPDAKLAELKGEYDDLIERAYGLARKQDGAITLERAVELALDGEEVSDEEERVLAWMVAAYEELQWGVDASELAVRDEEGLLPGGDELFPNGYEQIIRILAEGTTVRLGEIVQRIDAIDGGVRVTTSHGVHEAAYAIVTLPLGVLKKGSVAFSPPLPARKQGAIDRLAMGALNKIALVFPRAFWPKERHFLGYMSAERGELAIFQNLLVSTSAPVLLAFVAGRFSDKIAGLPDADVQALVMKVLRSIFGESIPAPTAMIRTHWERDPFAFGSYAHVPVGAETSDMDVLAEPVGSIHFAGEATSWVHSGTVHGAMLSGIREAKLVAARSR